MAYSVNGKIYTDHPLMDEIVDCCKTIFKGIVVKNDALAISYETEESMDNANMLFSVVENKISFSDFPFTPEMLASYTVDGVPVFTPTEVNAILNDRSIVPEEMRGPLLDYCKKYYIDNFEETNPYYRSLAGLPPVKNTVFNINRGRANQYYYIEIYKSDFPSDYDTHIDWDHQTEPVYVHELSPENIAILQMNGVLDSIIEEYRGFNYSYLRYLGYKSISIYKSRKAEKWQILYMPTVEQLVEQRFEELYNINRSIYLKRTYQDAMSLGSNHYDESLILLLLCQTFNDLVVDVPEWYIRRDIFDIRSVQYFLESFGVEFYDVIPLKYQIAIVKNLNKLIKYKSSTRNNNDIIDIFNLSGTYIYKYFLYKKRNNEGYDKDPENYDLEFIKVKQGEPFDKYIDDNIYRYKYDDLTLEDKYWDGVYREWGTSSDKSFKEQLHETVENAHKEKVDYTVEGTKYMSIDYEVDMSEQKYQVEYFFSYLLDSEINTDDLKIIVPSISTSTEIPISDLFVLLFLLSFAYDDVSDNITEKESINEKTGLPIIIKGKRPEDNINHKETIVGERAEYYEQLYTNDGDYDDCLKWNEIFGQYIPPEHYDTDQFDFGYNIVYDPETAFDSDYNFYYSPPEEIPDPETDEGYDFEELISIEPDDFFEQFFVPKHWEVKTYIENQDIIGTSLGINTFPVWADDQDWARRRVPEVLKTAYNRINGFNSQLTPEDLDNMFEVIGRRIKVYGISERYKNQFKAYNFARGYKGYSYRPVNDVEGNLLYYEILYNFTEDVYTYEDYTKYVDPDISEEDFNDMIEEAIEDFMRENPRGPLGIGGLRIVKKLDTIKAITENFDINTICYNDLTNRMVNADSRDESIMLRYVFNTLFTREFDYNFYKVNEENVNNYSDILKARNYILYNYYNLITNESNIDTRKSNIRSLTNDIITTLEYYISSDNLEFIYSSFSITSFSSLLYYIYLMIQFFKSWKVYFLDPAVTMNADDRLESGNNYGSGVDSIAETKLNYWDDDKEFKRDILNTEMDIDVIESDPKDRYKEVLDTYGHFDPDPEDDYDYDGYIALASTVTYKQADGGVADGTLNIPYKMINGGVSYGKFLDIWDMDGGDAEEKQNYNRVDGGTAYHEEDFVPSSESERLYSYMINGGHSGTNQFWTKSVHTKVIDRQIEQDLLVSDREANVIVQNNDGIYIKQAWAAWNDFAEIKEITDNTYEYTEYVMQVLYEDLLVITDMDLLQQKINDLVNSYMYNIRKVTNYAEHIDSEKAGYKYAIDNKNEQLFDIYGSFSPYSWDQYD